MYRLQCSRPPRIYGCRCTIVVLYLLSFMRRIFRMLPRLPAVTRCLTLAALCVAGPVSALELPLPPPGEDIIGQVQVIKAKYEDTFADLGTTYDLGYSEMVAA